MAGAHQKVIDERDLLSREKGGLLRQVDRLEKANASLDSQSVAIFEQLEDMRGVRETLDSDVARLKRREHSLSENLADREMQLVAQSEEVSRLRGTYEGLVIELESEVAAGQIEIEQLRVGLQVNVSDEILFASGSATLNGEGAEVLAKVSNQLASMDYRIEVRGHTDNIPISGALAKRYPSNWELAGARSSSVVRLFLNHGIAGERLTSVSRGEFEPVASNDTAEDRWLNRRIEIRLLPQVVAATPEPAEESAADERAGETTAGEAAIEEVAEPQASSGSQAPAESQEP